MASKGTNGIESGSTGADPFALRVWHSESNGGGGDPAHSLGSLELPLVELGLLGAGSRENDCIPSGNPRGVAYG